MDKPDFQTDIVDCPYCGKDHMELPLYFAETAWIDPEGNVYPFLGHCPETQEEIWVRLEKEDEQDNS